MNSEINTIFFDLDGTLVDTAPDLSNALNQTRINRQLSALPYEIIRPHVSNGAAALVEFGFNITPTSPDFNTIREELIDIYKQTICNKSGLFPGMNSVLTAIESSGKKWGVVTNKPAYLTDPLMAGLELDKRAACIVSGDTTSEKKPHPMSLLHACMLTQSKPGTCIYIGDARRDIQAGRNAAMKTVAAEYGYINKNDNIKDWGADAIIQTPEDILNVIKSL